MFLERPAPMAAEVLDGVTELACDPAFYLVRREGFRHIFVFREHAAAVIELIPAKARRNAGARLLRPRFCHNDVQQVTMLGGTRAVARNYLHMGAGGDDGAELQEVKVVDSDHL